MVLGHRFKTKQEKNNKNVTDYRAPKEWNKVQYVSPQAQELFWTCVSTVIKGFVLWQLLLSCWALLKWCVHSEMNTARRSESLTACKLLGKVSGHNFHGQGFLLMLPSPSLVNIYATRLNCLFWQTALNI